MNKVEQMLIYCRDNHINRIFYYLERNKDYRCCAVCNELIQELYKKMFLDKVRSVENDKNN